MNQYSSFYIGKLYLFLVFIFNFIQYQSQFSPKWINASIFNNNDHDIIDWYTFEVILKSYASDLMEFRHFAGEQIEWIEMLMRSEYWTWVKLQNRLQKFGKIIPNIECWRDELNLMRFLLSLDNGQWWNFLPFINPSKYFYDTCNQTSFQLLTETFQQIRSYKIHHPKWF